MITPEDYMRMDKENYIYEKDKKKYPSIHFCQEWDGMLIYKEDPEFEYCLCFK